MNSAVNEAAIFAVMSASGLLLPSELHLTRPHYQPQHHALYHSPSFQILFNSIQQEFLILGGTRVPKKKLKNRGRN